MAAALEHIGKLYQVETHIRSDALTGNDKRAYRQAHAQPQVDAFFAWCDAQCQRMDLVPSNKLSKALKYVRTRERALRLYLDDPALAIDTNHLERTLRAIPMGKNYRSLSIMQGTVRGRGRTRWICRRAPRLCAVRVDSQRYALLAPIPGRS